MPHLTPENSANLAHDASIGQLCQALAQCLDAQRKHDQRVYPLGDICMRALRCEQYYVADGHGNAASLHANLNFDARRSGSAKNAIGNALFARIRQHLAAEFERHGPSLHGQSTSSAKPVCGNTTTRTRA